MGGVNIILTCASTVNIFLSPLVHIMTAIEMLDVTLQVR